LSNELGEQKKMQTEIWAKRERESKNERESDCVRTTFTNIMCIDLKYRIDHTNTREMIVVRLSVLEA
jgi:hypothetical protein